MLERTRAQPASRQGGGRRTGRRPPGREPEFVYRRRRAVAAVAGGARLPAPADRGDRERGRWRPGAREHAVRPRRGRQPDDQDAEHRPVEVEQRRPTRPATRAVGTVTPSTPPATGGTGGGTTATPVAPAQPQGDGGGVGQAPAQPAPAEPQGEGGGAAAPPGPLVSSGRRRSRFTSPRRRFDSLRRRREAARRLRRPARALHRERALQPAAQPLERQLPVARLAARVLRHRPHDRPEPRRDPLAAAPR